MCSKTIHWTSTTENVLANKSTLRFQERIFHRFIWLIMPDLQKKTVQMNKFICERMFTKWTELVQVDSYSTLPYKIRFTHFLSSLMAAILECAVSSWRPQSFRVLMTAFHTGVETTVNLLSFGKPTHRPLGKIPTSSTSNDDEYSKRKSKVTVLSGPFTKVQLSAQVI